MLEEKIRKIQTAQAKAILKHFGLDRDFGCDGCKKIVDKFTKEIFAYIKKLKGEE